MYRQIIVYGLLLLISTITNINACNCDAVSNPFELKIRAELSTLVFVGKVTRTERDVVLGQKVINVSYSVDEILKGSENFSGSNITIRYYYGESSCGLPESALFLRDSAYIVTSTEDYSGDNWIGGGCDARILMSTIHRNLSFHELYYQRTGDLKTVYGSVAAGLFAWTQDIEIISLQGVVKKAVFKKNKYVSGVDYITVTFDIVTFFTSPVAHQNDTTLSVEYPISRYEGDCGLQLSNYQVGGEYTTLAYYYPDGSLWWSNACNYGFETSND